MARRRQAAALIHEQLEARWFGEREVFLLEVLAGAAAALIACSGPVRTAEVLYRYADATVVPDGEP